MIVFDGYAFAGERELVLKKRVDDLAAQGKQLSIAAILFAEDKGSQLYTNLKSQAAQRVGIGYAVHTFSMKDSLEDVVNTLKELNADPAVTGIIIQKPWRKTWETVMETEVAAGAQFSTWWSELVQNVDRGKDVDGLHPETLEAVRNGTWQREGKVLPATVKAVLSILDSAGLLIPQKYVVIGKSDILGLPLVYELKNRGFEVESLGRKDLHARHEDGRLLKDADVVVAATGHYHLVTGEMLKKDVILVDVGEPRPDIDQASVESVAKFLTPVPGGVGPVTVVSLLENAVELVVL
jgi:methylenetetrahydrofolate dehydrogenase (NADP+) / methenyltetrahydrofolate cyclohydrolase